MKLRTFGIIFILILAISSACALPMQLMSAGPTPDMTAVQLAAEQTVIAKLTQNAPSAPTDIPATISPEPSQTSTMPTIEPSATSIGSTATSTEKCDAAQFLVDVSIADGTNFHAGDVFVKTWRIKNVGSCAWTSAYTLAFDGGNAMNGIANINFPVSNVSPGESVDLSVQLKAPSSSGNYVGYWGIKNASGAWVPVNGGVAGRTFTVDISVGSAVPTASSAFTVTNVSLSLACAPGTYTVVAKVSANKAGDVEYHWKRSDGATAPHEFVHFGGEGKKQVTTYWMTTATGLWLEFYVDSPNHDKMGHIDLNCP